MIWLYPQNSLAKVCQPLPDVSKANIHVNKIALISLANKLACPLQGLVEHAQNAGYSLVIFLDHLYTRFFYMRMTLKEKLLISVLMKIPDFCRFSTDHSPVNSIIDYVKADRTNTD